MRPDPQGAAKKIKWVVMDVDGVMTDGGIAFTNTGDEFKIFNSRDGHGVTLARRSGLKTAIITGRTSEVVSRRAKELKIDACYQGEYNKIITFEEMLKEHNLTEDEIAYIGDDVQDAPLLKRVGFSATPADGVPELDSVVHYRTTLGGGHGALREFLEYIMKAQGSYLAILKDFGL